MRSFRAYSLSMLALSVCILATNVAAAADAKLLASAEASKFVPATVFFRGQVASVQARNSGGIQLPGGMLVLCSLVDTSGYSTAVQQKYQAYLITEVDLEINGQTLKPGAYGVGFVEHNRFVVMDLGAHDLFSTASQRDAELKRPTPLQVLADVTAGHYRLYINRSYVVVAPGH